MASPELLPQLLNWLDGADLPSDCRLPPERQLSAELGATRAELRKALAVLENQGILRRHVGQGTFVVRSAVRAADTAAIADRTSPVDTVHARLLLEPELARLAAMHATSRELSEMRKLADEMRQAGNWIEYVQIDARLHRLIAKAARNNLLTEILDLIYSVRSTIVWGRMASRPPGPTPDYISFSEHDAILQAIEERDSATAADAMRVHLLTAMKRLQEVDARTQSRSNDNPWRQTVEEMMNALKGGKENASRSETLIRP
jgi:GntR family transcriptional regulator, transcriptional repressor for pyruvate dehydrogenase complex